MNLIVESNKAVNLIEVISLTLCQMYLNVKLCINQDIDVMQIFAKIKISEYAHIEIEIIIFFFQKSKLFEKKNMRKKQNHNITFLTEKNDKF